MANRKTAEDRKAEIVEAALRLADKVGPDRLSTEAVADAVGVTQAAIFRHFPKKQDLWEAAAARIGEAFQERWTKVERLGASSEEKLRRLIIGQLKLIRSTPAIPAILFSRELHVENDRLRKVFSTLMQHFHGLAVRFIVEGQRKGAFRSDVDPDDAAFLVIGTVQGLVLRWSLNKRGFDLVAEGERLLGVLLRGFQTPVNRPPAVDPAGRRCARGSDPEHVGKESEVIRRSAMTLRSPEVELPPGHRTAGRYLG
jgi:AcrR family transcriptional regulator